MIARHGLTAIKAATSCSLQGQQTLHALGTERKRTGYKVARLLFDQTGNPTVRGHDGAPLFRCRSATGRSATGRLIRAAADDGKLIMPTAERVHESWYEFVPPDPIARLIAPFQVRPPERGAVRPAVDDDGPNRHFSISWPARMR
jgi:hypothetical protein